MNTGRNYFKRLRQRGLTLIEAAMVLGIAALVGAGVMLYFQNASIASKTNEAMRQLANVQQSVRSVYSGQSSYTGLAATDLINTRAVPQSMVQGGTNLRNAFNGGITLAAANTGGGTANSFSVTFSQVPNEACSKMSTMDLGNGLVSLVVNGNTFTSPPTAAAASAACGTGNGTQSLTWTFF